MKVIYEFEEDDFDQLKTHQNAMNFECALADMGNYLRVMALGKTDKIDSIDKIYDRFFEILSNNNLNRDIIGF